MADEYKEALTNAFRLKIFRVPKHVQRLKLPEYVATYGSLPFVEAARAPEVQKDDEEDEDIEEDEEKNAAQEEIFANPRGFRVDGSMPLSDGECI